MKRYLVLIVVMFVVLLGCNKKDSNGNNETVDFQPNNVPAKTFRDALYEDYKSIVFRGDAENNIPSVLLLDFNERFINGIKDANSNFESAQKTWNLDGNEPQNYHNAAVSLLSYVELIKGQWLSLGNTIKYLGMPSKIIEDSIYFDSNDDSIDSSGVVNTLKFQDKGVSVEISATGFVKSVLYNKNNTWSGIGPMNWPHKYSYVNSYPIIAGVFPDQNRIRTLYKMADKLTKGHL